MSGKSFTNFLSLGIKLRKNFKVFSGLHWASLLGLCVLHFFSSPTQTLTWASPRLFCCSSPPSFSHPSIWDSGAVSLQLALPRTIHCFFSLENYGGQNKDLAVSESLRQVNVVNKACVPCIVKEALGNWDVTSSSPKWHCTEKKQAKTLQKFPSILNEVCFFIKNFGSFVGCFCLLDLFSVLWPWVLHPQPIWEVSLTVYTCDCFLKGLYIYIS